MKAISHCIAEAAGQLLFGPDNGNMLGQPISCAKRRWLLYLRLGATSEEQFWMPSKCACPA